MRERTRWAVTTMGKAAGEEILAVAAREIGYREGAGRRTKYGEWYGMDGVAWCMQFVQWVYHQAGADLPCKTASCGELLRWYRQNQPECVTKEPVPGCVVIFDFPGTAYSTDHTGLFVSKTGTQITSIDGNTSNGNDSNGGWVQRRTRAISYANPTYIVPRELKTDGGEDEDMTRYNTMEEIRAGAPWAADTVKKLIGLDCIRGNGAPADGDGNPTDMDLSQDMLRMLVVNDRAGLYR